MSTSRRQFIASALAASVSLTLRTARRPLWSARKKGGVVYIVGETWPGPTDWHDATIEALLPRCGRLWTETNQVFRRPTKELIEQFGATSDASPLKLLSPEQMTRLHKAADLCGVSLNDYSGMRPWVIGASLEDAFYQKVGLTGKSARGVLMAQADAAGIPVSSEFAVKDDVFAFFGGLSPTEDVQFLGYEMDGVLLGRAGSQRISSNWIAGRTEPAAEFVDHMRRAYPELYEKLSLDRNRGWVPRFDSMVLDQKPTMVIIGMFHLVGAESVLTQLRRAGYDVVNE